MPSIGAFERGGRRGSRPGTIVRERIITSVTDRSHWPTRKLRLEDEDRYDDTATLTPGERIEMVWEITKSAWAFKDPSFHESRLRRDIARVIRNRR